MLSPTLKDAQAISGYDIIPVKREFLSDFITPIEALRKLQNVSRHCYILESVENREKWGRYTFLGYDPTIEISCLNGELTVKDVRSGDVKQYHRAHPADIIREIMAKMRSPKPEGFPSFTGGLVGYFSYDYIKYSEPSLALDASDEEHFKDVDLMLFDKVIAFDNIHQKIMLIANISTKNIAEEYKKAEKELFELETLIRTGKPAEVRAPKLKSEFRHLFGKDAFCEMVEKAKRYIYEGDIFQVVLSNRLDADFEGGLLDVYRILRAANPSPYMFYFSSDDMEAAGASPETLVKLENGILHTFPIAGSRPRGRTDEEDMAFERELLADEKELSEHNMLVDLGRNDISKISKFGTVEVERYMEILRYSHIMHIASTVKGQIKDGCDALDAINAVLPAGTLSGAPKIRACEIINELENNKRGIYGGAIGYIGFNGGTDTCIGIRLCYKKNGHVFVRAGAGIVADSDPEREFTECVNKAKAVVNALNDVTEREGEL